MEEEDSGLLSRDRLCLSVLAVCCAGFYPGGAHPPWLFLEHYFAWGFDTLLVAGGLFYSWVYFIQFLA